MVFHFVLNDGVHIVAGFVGVVKRAGAELKRGLSDAGSGDARRKRRRMRSDKIVDSTPDVVIRGMIDHPFQQ